MRTVTTLKSLLLLAGLLALAGCQDPVNHPDLTAPAPPQGIVTVNGDNAVDVFWVRNTEPDLAGYRVYVSPTYGGSYTYIGTSHTTSFHDDGARNGQTTYYAVSAYDAAGNESDLSVDVAYETPRPDGFNVGLASFTTSPNAAGYDFSTYSVGPYDDLYTDVYFEVAGTRRYFDVWTDSDIQDMGYTASLDEITTAPPAGWSPTKDAQVIVGHTYAIRTWDNHFAKVRVTQVSATGVTFDWAYQLQEGNRQLKAIAERGTLQPGPGVVGRN